jgi:hypothetical protein
LGVSVGLISPPPENVVTVEKLSAITTGQKHLKRPSEIKDLEGGPGICRGALPEGTRQIGRPTVRWLDPVEEDMKKVGFRNWKTKITRSGPMESNSEGGLGWAKVPVEKQRKRFS